MRTTVDRLEPQSAAVGLRRTLGRWSLTAIGINLVVGGGVFLVHSEIASRLGRWSLLAFITLAFLSVLVGLCFAEVGSRFEGTGGLYLYVRAAFGRPAGFQAGWLYWFTRATGQASITNGLVLAVGFYWPAATHGFPRWTLISLLTVTLAAINVRGIRPTAWVINAFTVGKLVPLGIFIVVGAFFANPAVLIPAGPFSWGAFGQASLILIFIFGGYEVVAVPAGEASDPRRDVPRAVITTVLLITLVNTLVFAVVAGTLPGLALSHTPVADAASGFMGAPGALLIGVATVISITGTNMGQILAGSRMLFALSEAGDLPAFFGRIHPRFRTPVNSILFSTAVALVLALSGSFVLLAAASAIARLLTYIAVCASTLVLRRRTDGSAGTATYVAPLGPVVPVAAILILAALLLGVSREQVIGGALTIAAGMVLYALRSGRPPRELNRASS